MVKNSKSLGKNNKSVVKNNKSVGKNNKSLGKNNKSLGKNIKSLGKNINLKKGEGEGNIISLLNLFKKKRSSFMNLFIRMYVTLFI